MVWDFLKPAQPGRDEGAARVETILRMSGACGRLRELRVKTRSQVGLTRRGGDRKVVPRLSGRAFLRG